MKNRNLGHIESIRAIAALSVAAFHFTHYSAGDNILITNENLKSVTLLGAQGVELFYAISGFIIPYALFASNYTIKNYLNYLKKRVVRLFPPYVATIIAINIVSIILCTFIWHIDFDINFRQIAANTLFIADFFPTIEWINPIFITLKVELQFYLLIGIMLPFILKKRIYLLFFLIVFLGAGIFTRDYYTVFINAPYFSIGLIAFYIFQFGWKLETVAGLALIFSMLFYYFPWEDLTVALLAFLLILYLPKQLNFLNLTGKISYSFYLTHGLFGGWFIYFFMDTSLSKNHPWITIIFALVISWIGAFCMYYLIEKPCLRLSAKIKYKPN